MSKCSLKLPHLLLNLSDLLAKSAEIMFQSFVKKLLLLSGKRNLYLKHWANWHFSLIRKKCILLFSTTKKKNNNNLYTLLPAITPGKCPFMSSRITKRKSEMLTCLHWPGEIYLDKDNRHGANKHCVHNEHLRDYIFYTDASSFLFIPFVYMFTVFVSRNLHQRRVI